MPTIFEPIIDVAKNKNFLGIPIESEREKHQYPTERVRHYTGIMAKSLSRAFNEIGIKYSPIQIDYMLDSYTGGFFRQLPVNPILEPADIPVLGDFLLRMPEAPERQLNNYYSDYEYLSQKNQSGIINREEKRKLDKISLIYSSLNLKFRKMRTYRENEDVDKIRKTYEDIRKLLQKVGYK